MQNTPYEFAVGTEELNTIKALQLLWPLLQTKNIIRILAKIIKTSDMIHDILKKGPNQSKIRKTNINPT